jgi:hypothetical protein
MVLNASYVCLHAFSLRRESPDPDPERRTPHFWGGSVTVKMTTMMRSKRSPSKGVAFPSLFLVFDVKGVEEVLYI